MSDMPGPLRVERLDDGIAATLDRDGYLLLRGAIPAAWIEPLRRAFEAGFVASTDWTPPRGPDWRHALVDLEPPAVEVCHLPILLSAAHHRLKQPFFLSQVEGREPRPGGGNQPLHRDGSGAMPTEVVSAIAFLDPFGPANGATKLVPGSHHDLEPPTDAMVAITVEGDAGDILLFDANLLHGGTLNSSGAPRRSLLINYFAAPLWDDHLRTLAIRNIRMSTGGMFGG